MMACISIFRVVLMSAAWTTRSPSLDVQGDPAAIDEEEFASRNTGIAAAAYASGLRTLGHGALRVGELINRLPAEIYRAVDAGI